MVLGRTLRIAEIWYFGDVAFMFQVTEFFFRKRATSGVIKYTEKAESRKNPNEIRNASSTLNFHQNVIENYTRGRKTIKFDYFQLYSAESDFVI